MQRSKSPKGLAQWSDQLDRQSLPDPSCGSYRASSASSSSRKRLAASRSSMPPGLRISTSSSVPGGHGVLTASSNRISSSQGLLFGAKPSKAVATKAVRSKVCLGGISGPAAAATPSLFPGCKAYHCRKPSGYYTPDSVDRSPG